MDSNDAHKEERKASVSLRRWNRVLVVLAWLGIVWSIYLIGDAFFGSDFLIGLKTTSGIKLLTASDFSTFERMVVVLIMIPSLVCWIYCLWQIVRLSRHFSKGEILSIGMVKCLERFSYGIAIQGVAEAVQLPMLSTYLRRLNKIDPVEDLWEHVIGGGVLTSMMAAVLIVVVARILRIGIQLREEAELTI